MAGLSHRIRCRHRSCCPHGSSTEKEVAIPRPTTIPHLSPGRGRAGDLDRVLGLAPTLSIGVGTMIGAGVFIFPGLAGGRSGPAAIVSFALGGLIALLVAVCTAELATAMPDSGGAYHFVSRTFGPLAGTLVGLGQWIGLAFASAFYLVGFGRYASVLMDELGVPLGDPSVLMAVGTALTLTVLNVVGAERAGRFQSVIVITLTSVLTLLFGYGVLETTGVVGPPAWPTPFAPRGIAPIFGTAALVFTSYLGFVQIATVAGEVRRPHRTLPLALLGSVAIATTFYVAVVFVCTSLLSADRLASLGETAVVEVARSLFGRAGALAIMSAGLLATLSSANASILSSSRSLYALGQDGLVPAAVARVSNRFRTPHVALLAVGIPIAGLVFSRRLEMLAEVASVLHLVVYGLICTALVVLRHRRPRWYTPSFHAPAGPVAAILGAIASFGLIAFMGHLALLIGGAVGVGSSIWYLAYGQGRASDRRA